MCSDCGYKKPTRFWTNIKGFNPKKCKMNCDNLIAVEKGGKVQHLHKECLGSSAAVETVEVDGKIIRRGGSNRLERYRIPDKLIEGLLACVDDDEE